MLIARIQKASSGVDSSEEIVDDEATTGDATPRQPLIITTRNSNVARNSSSSSRTPQGEQSKTNLEHAIPTSSSNETRPRSKPARGKYFIVDAT